MEHKMMWLLSPYLRNNILGSLESLANKELQLTKWIDANYQHSFWNELRFCFSTLFDDAYALEKNTQIIVGFTMYNEEEVKKVNKFCYFFDNLTEEIGDKECDMAYYGHPQWQKIIDDAAELVEIMERNNKANDFSECLEKFNYSGFHEYRDFVIEENNKNGYKL